MEPSNGMKSQFTHNWIHCHWTIWTGGNVGNWPTNTHSFTRPIISFAAIHQYAVSQLTKFLQTGARVYRSWAHVHHVSNGTSSGATSDLHRLNPAGISQSQSGHKHFHKDSSCNGARTPCTLISMSVVHDGLQTNRTRHLQMTLYYRLILPFSTMQTVCFSINNLQQTQVQDKL